MREMRAHIGVDPGSSTGAMCILLEDGSYKVFSFEKYTPKEWFAILQNWYNVYECEVCCERVHGMPKMNVVAISSFMKNVGQIEMALAVCGFPTRYITPQTWMKYYGVKKEKGEGKTVWKKRLREVLQQRLPSVECTTEQADAVLIALYGRCTRV